MEDDGWRPMIAADIAAVSAISDAVHGDYTERPEVYAERLALYPAGCFLFAGEGGAAGYLIAHPWLRNRAVPLNAALGALPTDPDCLYLHDLALLPTARGTGAGRSAVRRVVDLAKRAGFGEIRLVAVNGAESFWVSQGFAALSGKESADASYGADAVYMRRMLQF
jgi:GNAT superfamily N-acetyltransferase